MKPFQLQPQSLLFHGGLAVMIAAGVGGIFASGERDINIVALSLVLGGIVGLLGHLRWTAREQRLASRLAALAGLGGIVVGTTLWFSPAESLDTLRIFNISSWRDALSHGVMLGGAVSIGMFAIGRRAAESRWSLAVSPRWLFVAPIGVVGGWAIGWEQLAMWEHMLIALFGIIVTIGVSVWQRDWLYRKVGLSLHQGAVALILLTIVCTPGVAIDGHVGIGETLVWLFGGVAIVAIVLWWRTLGLVLGLSIWMALGAIEIAADGRREIFIAAFVVGAVLMALHKWAPTHTIELDQHVQASLQRHNRPQDAVGENDTDRQLSDNNDASVHTDHQ